MRTRRGVVSLTVTSDAFKREIRSQTDGVKEALATDQLCGDRCNETDHRQSTIEHLGTLMESPTGVGVRKHHGRFFGINIVMTFKIVSDQSCLCLECGCRHGAFRVEPDRSMPAAYPVEAGTAARRGSVSGPFPSGSTRAYSPIHSVLASTSPDGLASAMQADPSANRINAVGPAGTTSRHVTQTSQTKAASCAWADASTRDIWTRIVHKITLPRRTKAKSIFENVLF